MNARGAKRRRLAKAGIGAAGILWTLESRATMTTGPRCVAPSAAAMSGGNSNYADKNSHCGAQGPDYWCKISYYWPCSRNITFGELFHCRGGNDGFGKLKLVDILGKDEYRNHVGRELANAFLNVLTGKLYVISTQTLTKMWNDLQSKGYYSPKRRVQWTAHDVRDYLEATWRG